MKIALGRIYVCLAFALLCVCACGCELQGFAGMPSYTTAPPVAAISPVESAAASACGTEASPPASPSLSPSPTPSPSPSPSAQATAAVLYVAGNGVNMRESPSTQARVLMSLARGTQVERLGIEGDWSRVCCNGETGYIRSDLLGDTQPSAAASAKPPSGAADRIRSPKIVVRKSQRVLELWDGDTLCESFPIALGWEPAGHKRVEGDGRTPEGSYYVCLRNPNSSFYLSLGVSYPNKKDAKDALDAGTIDQSTYRRIADAIDGKTRPPWNTPLGGEIMIHGGGAGSDWTAGCIAVENDAMDILWKHCPDRTPIQILP